MGYWVEFALFRCVLKDADKGVQDPPLDAILKSNGHKTTPLGQIELPITFGERDNCHMANVIFDAAYFYLPYKAILGRPVLTKLLMVVHYTYGMVKIPGQSGVIYIKSDTKGTVHYAEVVQGDGDDIVRRRKTSLLPRPRNTLLPSNAPP